MRNLFLLVISAVLLTACNTRYSSSGENLYLQSRNGAKLVVPPPLTSSNISNFYDLPAQNEPAQVSIAPPVDEIPTS